MLSRMRVGIFREKHHVLAACDGLVRGRVDGHGVMEWTRFCHDDSDFGDDVLLSRDDDPPVSFWLVMTADAD